MSHYLTIALLALLGAVYGSVVGFLNHQVLVKGWNKITPENLSRVKKIKHNVMIRYAIHFFIDVLALLIVAKWTPFLLGTACGIVIMQKILIVKYIKSDKEVKNNE